MLAIRRLKSFERRLNVDHSPRGPNKRCCRGDTCSQFQLTSVNCLEVHAIFQFTRLHEGALPGRRAADVRAVAPCVGHDWGARLQEDPQDKARRSGGPSIRCEPSIAIAKPPRPRKSAMFRNSFIPRAFATALFAFRKSICARLTNARLDAAKLRHARPRRCRSLTEVGRHLAKVARAHERNPTIEVPVALGGSPRGFVKAAPLFRSPVDDQSMVF